MDSDSSSLAGRPRLRGGGDSSLLSFFLGPVQPFIASARSVRDLWSGSFLLSWLTRSAMSPVLENPGLGDDAFLMPFQPSLVWDRCLKAGGELPAASLPNRFLAMIPADPEGKMALTLAEQCKSSCRNAWKEICERVRQGFDEKMGARALSADWDRLWNSQVDTFFEIQAASLPLRSCDQATLSHLLSEQEFDPKRTSCQWWGALNLMARLLEAQRAEGYVPAYRAAGHVPQKCTLLGTYEQMGPAAFDDSNVFWRALAQPSWYGTRIRPVERLCAVSLIKRFAWPAFFREELHLEPRAGYYPDTATIAAALWLAEGDFAIDPRDELENSERWSGQWLHWATLDRPSGKRNEDEQQKYDPPPTQNQGNRIRAKRQAQGPPPAYYAILVLDGDRMGSWLRGEKTPGAGPNELIPAISKALAHFATQIAPVVAKKHSGTLIYAGGDDVLAVLPTRTALACAQELNQQFTSSWNETLGQFGGDSPTISGGVVVVHYKEDLRFALGQAREAEKRAKGEGRDRLALTICRRSGEHTSVVIPWGIVGELQKWNIKFDAGASDRWLYTLRSELPALGGELLPWEGIEAEVRRLAGRVEGKDKRIDPDDAVRLLKVCREATSKRENEPQDRRKILGDFITLGQSASFLARGGGRDS